MSDTLRILQSRLGDAATQALLAMIELSATGLCVATQQEIAEARGVNRSAIARPMRQLQGASVIEMLQPGVYRIDLSHLPTE